MHMHKEVHFLILSVIQGIKIALLPIVSCFYYEGFPLTDSKGIVIEKSMSP